MATFAATVEEVKVETHPNADRLEIAKVGDYKVVVGKDQYKTGDLAVYIPEQSVLPAWLIEALGLEGKLSGKDANRVKAIKLRQVLSQGLLYPLAPNGDFWELVSRHDTGQPRYTNARKGEVVTDLLGITKWEPPIPVSMAGEVWNASGKTLKYDIENYKRFPSALMEGEEVVFTEKLHGTWCCIGSTDEDYVVASKGLSGRGLAFKLNAANVNNLYVRQFKEHGGLEILEALREELNQDYIYILGEIFGKGVQDLAYAQTKPSFRIFDIFVGNPASQSGYYCDYDDLVDLVSKVNETISDKFTAELVPELYRGPFSVAVMEEYTTGKETISGKGANIREGIVIKPTKERYEETIDGRLILKSVSDDYLTRKGNVTEYQ